jgi:predicted transposase YbfD/YdcC
MAAFGRAKITLLKRFLKLKHGIPSHDMFSTVFRMVEPKALDAAFGRLTATLTAALAKGGVIAIDGKSLRGVYEKGEKSSPRMMVSAYAAGLRLSLATVAAKDRNEVDAALEVLGLIDLKGKIVTADALHCNRRMVVTIVEKGGLKAFGRIESARTIEGRTETEVRFYALSRKLTAQELLATARAHWQIENALHWKLDVSFREDAQRNRKDNGPANIAVLRRSALDAARLDPSKGSLTTKLKRAGWDDELMLKLLSQMR